MLFRCFLACLLGSAAAADTLDTGRKLFSANCVECHGRDARETQDIRGASLQMVSNAVDGLESMPVFDFTDAELEALVLYLDHLDQR